MFLFFLRATRRFKPPWTLIRENSECYTVQDASGVTVAWLYCRDDSRVTARQQAHIGRSAPDRKGHQPNAPGLLSARLRADRPHDVVLLPWNLRDELMAQLDYVRGWGGRFVTAVPELRCVP